MTGIVPISICGMLSRRIPPQLEHQPPEQGTLSGTNIMPHNQLWFRHFLSIVLAKKHSILVGKSGPAQLNSSYFPQTAKLHAVSWYISARQSRQDNKALIRFKTPELAIQCTSCLPRGCTPGQKQIPFYICFTKFQRQSTEPFRGRAQVASGSSPSLGWGPDLGLVTRAKETTRPCPRRPSAAL